MRWHSFIIGVALLTFVAACGETAAHLNNDGNEAHAVGEYSDALNSYTAAKLEDPTLPEPYYNSGNTLHIQGKFDESTMQHQESIRSSDEAVRKNSFYNLGNSFFKQELWQEAVDAYSQSLLLDPNDADAKYNLELALEKLQEQQQQPPPPQQSENQPNQGEGEGDQPEQPQQPQNGDQGEEEEDGEGGQGEQEQDQGQGDQPQEQQPQSGQGELSPEEAKQILDALGQDSQTLQERLQQQFGGQSAPPAQDW